MSIPQCLTYGEEWPKHVTMTHMQDIQSRANGVAGTLCDAARNNKPMAGIKHSDFGKPFAVEAWTTAWWQLWYASARMQGIPLEEHNDKDERSLPETRSLYGYESYQGTIQAAGTYAGRTWADKTPPPESNKKRRHRQETQRITSATANSTDTRLRNHTDQGDDDEQE
jgi:hypothetical protein